jgi:acetoin utilization protein AcuB
MNLYDPIKKIMTRDVITVNPTDPLSKVKEIFESNNIHHIPVCKTNAICGMISKSDFLHFIRGIHHSTYDQFIEKSRLRAYKAEDIMTKGLAKMEPEDRINVALEVFKENMFHAIPIVKDDELVGIVTTLDIIRELANEESPVKYIKD